MIYLGLSPLSPSFIGAVGGLPNPPRGGGAELYLPAPLPPLVEVEAPAKHVTS